MKAFLLTFVLLLSSSSIFAQKLPEWYRVYTFDESMIEMNTTNVMLGGDIGRVTFRWIFDQPQQLSGNPDLRYKTRLETIEFKCADKSYRMYQMNFLDSSGKIIHSEKMTSPYTWAKIRSNSVMGALLSIACELVERKTVALMAPIPIPDEQIQLEKAAKFAVSFAESLERAKDFKPIIQRFFAADYLKGYLRDQDTNWFLNLNRDTAAKASHAQLQRFYVAFLNTGYLTSLYLISQSRLDDGESKVNEKLIPPDVFQLIENHPYTAAYRNKRETYDYLAENIDSLQRLRMYTDLLERLAVLMRKHVESAGAEHSTEYQGVLEEWDWSHSLYRPTIRTCATECFGFAKGTRLFEVDVPMFHLQFAQIKGQLRVVSAMDYFQ